jgi:hypothetical protein
MVSMSGRRPTGFEADADGTRFYGSSKKYSDSSYPSPEAEPGKKPGDTRRYKGGKGLHKRIRAAIAGGPKEWLEVLNAFERPGGDEVDYSDLARVARKVLKSPARLRQHAKRIRIEVVLLPLLIAFNCLRSMIMTMVADGNPRSALARNLLADAIRGLMDWNDRKDTRRPLPADTATAISYGCDEAIELLLSFWAADEGFLCRLRMCEYKKCSAPYFLDRAPARHARFCSPSHRALSHRVK